MFSLKVHTWQNRRLEMGYFFVIAMISTILIGFIKSQSAHACQWDMLHTSAYGSYWNFSATQGHCFPGGHASTGFALIVGYFVYRIQRPKRAYFFLITSLILGFTMGYAQMMRGAHFMSHNLWTAWIIWFLNVFSYTLCKNKLPTQLH